MTKEQIALVKSSWKTFQNVDASFVGDVFYSKLFIENPRLQKMFPVSMHLQYKKFVGMLSSMIAALDYFDMQSDEIAAMAKRHERYGVKPKHYKVAGDVLMWTLERGIGRDWNEKTSEAWRACYNMIANTMIVANQK